MERLSKAKFLELLQKVGKEDTSKSQRTGSNQQRNDDDGHDDGGKDRILKAKPKESRKPNWDVLSDDYMMGARLKDNL